MEKLFEPTKEEQERIRRDKDLFLKLLPIFEDMSNTGKEVTVETLLMYLLLLEEV